LVWIIVAGTFHVKHCGTAGSGSGPSADRNSGASEGWVAYWSQRACAARRLVFRIERVVCPVVWLLTGALVHGEARAELPARAVPPPFRGDRILVLPDPASNVDVAGVHRRFEARPRRVFPGMGGLQIVEVPAGSDIVGLIEAYRLAGVAWAEPDYYVYSTAVPDDPDYESGRQWYLHNTGQSGGLPGADIRAVEAWDRQSTASNIVVAVLDSGVRITHEDLAQNLWVNSGEIAGNGLDDDLNGFVDDVHGINASDGSGDVRDVAGHGTHVAGIIGAVGNNDLGIAGVAWRVQLLICRFIASDGSGSISDAVTCIDYAREMGARVLNASWVGTNYSAALELAIDSAREAGILFVAAAGNDGRDNDRFECYPANLSLDNIISVAATTRADELLGISNYGGAQVDLAAPGQSIYSTYFIVNNSYLSMAGSSPAAPQVAGAAALVLAAFPEASYLEVIDRIRLGSDPLDALSGRCQTGGRLNLARALDPGDFVAGPRQPLPARGVIGGLLRPDPHVFTVVNWSDGPLNWSVSQTEDWLDLVPVGGTLGRGERAFVIATFNDAALGLDAGRHENRLEFVSGLQEAAVLIPVVYERYPPTWLTLDAVDSDWRVGLRGEPGAVYRIESGSRFTDWMPEVTNTIPATGLLPEALYLRQTTTHRYFRAKRIGGIASDE
jgi:subtilisin family serine protease